MLSKLYPVNLHRNSTDITSIIRSKVQEVNVLRYNYPKFLLGSAGFSNNKRILDSLLKHLSSRDPYKRLYAVHGIYKLLKTTGSKQLNL